MQQGKAWADEEDGDLDQIAKEFDESLALSQKAKAEASGAPPTMPTGSGINADDEQKRLVFQEGQALFSAQSFEQLGLKKSLLDGVTAMGFFKPSKIQADALPLMLGANGTPRQNFIGQAKSGSGKTLAFLLCMLSFTNVEEKYTQAICLAPTRELANQIYKDALNVAKYMTGLEIMLVVPDIPKCAPPVRSHIIIATPGKLNSLMRQRKLLDFSRVKVFVLDEADEMLQKGMKTQVLPVKKLCPKDVQSLLFSATFTQEVVSFAARIVPQPLTRVLLEETNQSVSNIAHYVIDVGNEDEKYACLAQMYEVMNIGQSIIFINRIKTGAALASRLQGDGYEVSFTHGKLSPNQRDEVLDTFRKGQSSVLIATDVLSRGIDVPAVTLVVNYELPIVVGHGGPRNEPPKAAPSTFTHRVGRTARMGAKGVALHFVHDNASKAIMDGIVMAIPDLKLGVLLNDGSLYEQLEKMLRDLEEENKALRSAIAAGEGRSV